MLLPEARLSCIALGGKFIIALTELRTIAISFYIFNLLKLIFPCYNSQFNAQSSSISPQVGLGIGVQASGLNSVAASASLQPQPSPVHQSTNQQTIISTTPKDAGSLQFVFILTLVSMAFGMLR